MSNIERINIENLGSGAYILSVYNKPGNILISEKIIKKSKDSFTKMLPA